MRKLLLVFFAVLVTFQADDHLVAAGKAFCFDVENMLATLIGTGEARCLPSAGKTAGTSNPILIYARNVLSDPAKKQPTLLMTVAVVGKAMRDSSGIRIGDVVVSDIGSMKDRWALKFPGSLAKSLQIRMSADQIGLDAAYAELLKSTSKYAISAK